MSQILVIFFLILTICSWLYWLVAWGLVRALFRSRSTARSGFTPPVSILKPVKGLDVQAYRNFASFCQQDYPEFELLFGVSDPADPVVPVIERLQQDFPCLTIRLIVAPVIGLNRKASTLHALAAQARYEVLAVSDSDMRVTPDYLNRVVTPLADERVGMVTCPYRGEAALTLTARLEALHMGVTFLPSVAVGARFLNMHFALGATIALRRGDLERLGGFAAIVDHLADDFQLGQRMARSGLRVQLSDYVLASVLGATTFREQWQREVRWARCNRASVPWEYQGLLLTFSTPLAVGVLLLSGLAPWAWLVLAISVLERWLLGWVVTGYTGDREARRWLVWLPVRDMLSALVWGMGEFGRHIIWRGEEFIVRPDGRLQLASLAPARRPRVWAKLFDQPVRALDGLLRRYYHIYEFSTDEECMLRLAVNRADCELTLADGAQIQPGDLVGEIHFWNEHLPPMPPEGPNLAWARLFQRGMRRSFTQLAAYVEKDEHLKEIKAFRGEIFFGGRYGSVQRAKVAESWGLEIMPQPRPVTLWQKFSSFWRKGYALALIWTFNSASLPALDPRQVNQDHIWISRQTLLCRYGASKKAYDVAANEVKQAQLPVPTELPNLQSQAAS